MRQTITLSIPEPCHEDWNKMTPREKGRHCAACEKTVVDFTQQTDETIVKTYLKEHKLCGRFKATQLNRELVFSRKEKNNYASLMASGLFAFLSVGTQKSFSQGEPFPINKIENKVNTKKPMQSVLDNKVVKGTIFYNSERVNNAVISIKDKNIQVKTGANGNFYIRASIGDILVVSADGYARSEIELKEFKIQLIYLERIEQRTITGTIIEGGQPLPGANVVIKGSNSGTYTDFDGRYSINVNTNDILVFSFVGMRTTERKVLTSNTINVTLGIDDDQIIMIGGIHADYDPKTAPRVCTTEELEEQRLKKQRTSNYFAFYKRKKREHRQKIRSGEIKRTGVGNFLYKATNMFRSKK